MPSASSRLASGLGLALLAIALSAPVSAGPLVLDHAMIDTTSGGGLSRDTAFHGPGQNGDSSGDGKIQLNRDPDNKPTPAQTPGPANVDPSGGKDDPGSSQPAERGQPRPNGFDKSKRKSLTCRFFETPDGLMIALTNHGPATFTDVTIEIDDGKYYMASKTLESPAVFGVNETIIVGPVDPELAKNQSGRCGAHLRIHGVFDPHPPKSNM